MAAVLEYPKARRALERPRPPQALLDGDEHATFEPSEALAAWARASFIDAGAPLENPDHAHLEVATIGFLWTNALNEGRGRRVLGTCEPGEPSGSGWRRDRATLQIRRWFGHCPDFLITIDAMAAAEMSDAAFCALVEHELYHAGQAKDEFGQPKFDKLGRPVFTMRPHDVEEFIGVVRRYGGRDKPELERLIEAGRQTPEIGQRGGEGKLWEACGTCAGRAAA